MTRRVVLALVLHASPAAADRPICGGVTIGVGLMNPSGDRLTKAFEAYGGYMPATALCVLVDAIVADASHDTDEGTLYNHQRLVGAGVRYWFVRRAWVHSAVGYGYAFSGRSGGVDGDPDYGLSYALSAGADFLRRERFTCEVGVRYSDGMYDAPDPFWAATLNVGCGFH